jgi:hypothetical protein
MPIDLRKIQGKSFYGVAETARILGKSDQSVRLYIKGCQLDAKKGKDKRWRVKGTELLRFINEPSAD